MPASLFASLPAKFGRYRVLKKLGEGGMGAVFLAEDTQLGRKVALKLPAFGANESSRRIERFLREARSSAVLQHPNICTVFDAGEIDGRPFISMALIDGKSLEHMIDPDRPLPPEQAAGLVRKIALGLAHAHDRGIVHRDLKPANVMLTADGEPVVTDFGLARRVADADRDESRLTQQGSVLGTPSYMAPEQARGEIDRIGPAADVYALGVILFELLTGKTPYTGPMSMVLAQILVAPIPLLRSLRPDADPRLEELCRQAMAKEPADRPANMTVFADRLADFLTGRPVPAITAVPAPRPTASPTVRMEPSFDSLHDDTEAEEDEPARRSVTRERQRAGKNRSSMAPLLGAAIGLPLIALLVLGLVMILKPDPEKIEKTTAKQESGSKATPPKKDQATGTGTKTAAKTATVFDTTGLRAGEERDFVIAGNVRMRFCWIPAGRTTLGSPVGELFRGTDEAEHVFLTNGFWLGKYEVKQSEWEQVTSFNPSFHKGPDLPVERVNLKMCEEFARLRQVKDGLRAKIPSEDEWEYACRGGLENKQAFHWGDQLNGNMANHNGGFPYRTPVTGAYLMRTSPVGSYEKTAPHPWGLCDMAGNVAEWCDNLYASGDTLMSVRGGGWNDSGQNCRAARRDKYSPFFQQSSLGCRLALVP